MKSIRKVSDGFKINLDWCRRSAEWLSCALEIAESSTGIHSKSAYKVQPNGAKRISIFTANKTQARSYKKSKTINFSTSICLLLAVTTGALKRNKLWIVCWMGFLTISCSGKVILWWATKVSVSKLRSNLWSLLHCLRVW